MPNPLRFVLLVAATAALPAPAAVSGVSPSGFLVTHRVQTQAPPAALFEAIGQPARWWSAEHTYSGRAENLRMRLVAGGCFCEAWDRNAIEHARVIATMPPRWVRLEGALGPLQEMAVNAVLDFRMEPRAGGSTLTVTYRVRGSADAALDKIAPGVDKVLGEQVRSLAALVDAPLAKPRPTAFDERFVDAAGTRLRYIEMREDGDPVILLHDAGATSDSQWVQTGILKAMSDVVRAIALDAREPADVLHLMDALNIGKAHIVGYGLGAQQAAKVVSEAPDRFQTLTLAGSTSLRAPSTDPARRDLLVSDAAMAALPVPTLGIVGTQDPALRDFLALKPLMPRFVRMVAIPDATHDAAITSPDFTIAVMYFLRYNPMVR